MTSENVRMGKFCAQLPDQRSVGGVRALGLSQMSDPLEQLWIESIDGIARYTGPAAHGRDGDVLSWINARQGVFDPRSNAALSDGH